jgi:hypothetical protein
MDIDPLYIKNQIHKSSGGLFFYPLFLLCGSDSLSPLPASLSLPPHHEVQCRYFGAGGEGGGGGGTCLEHQSLQSLSHKVLFTLPVLQQVFLQ